MISIVIPLYNKETQIARTLQSVFAQTYTDYEIVIVNDGSTDNSVTIVEAINDPRIRLITQHNTGVSAARNKGIAEAKGDYIAFLDADDEWKPEYLETIAKLIKKYPECRVFATNYVFVSSDGKVANTILNNIKNNGDDCILDNYFEVAYCSNPPIWTSAVCVRKEALINIGGFPIGIKSGEDLLTWARLACRYNIAYCLKPLAIFNIEGYERNEKPKRIPADEDIVGKELRKLQQEFNPPYIKSYISFWHKMRGVIYWRLDMHKKSIKECLKAIRFNPLNLKAYAVIAANFVPKKLRP